MCAQGLRKGEHPLCSTYTPSKGYGKPYLCLYLPPAICLNTVQHPPPGHTHTRTHTRLTALFPGVPRWAGTRKVKPIWILLKQETVSGSGILASSACSRQTTTPAPHHSAFYRPDALPAAQPTASKHWSTGQYKLLQSREQYISTITTGTAEMQPDDGCMRPCSAASIWLLLYPAQSVTSL